MTHFEKEAKGFIGNFLRVTIDNGGSTEEQGKYLLHKRNEFN